MKTQKNEKVLHSRVSKDLYDKIASKARKNRISTSNLVRNLVEDYLEIHGEVWDTIDKKLRSYLDNDDKAIIGYQEIILSKDAKCSNCGKNLKEGTQGLIGLLENSSRKIVICTDCREKKRERKENNL